MSLPAATICHAIRGRLRIRVPGMRGHDAWFQETTAAIARRPEVSAVSANARTGTILMIGRDLEPASLAELARSAGWFELEAPADPRTGAAPSARGLAGLMLVLAAVQALRGQVMVPALSLAWFAVELLRWEERGGG